MKARIVRIGNSQGIRIPKPLLEAAGLPEEVELEVEGDCLVVRAAGRPRAFPATLALPEEGGLPGPSMVAEPMAIRRDDEGRHLSRLLDRALAGEEVVVTRSGRPVAKLVPLPREPRRPGRLAGKLVIAPDFDAPLPEGLAAAFRGDAGDPGEEN
jgi:antitoxin (DNA-binding transcriptional repressor) of toxin-antitoxin stability system/antitoxin component of MazEF toxin-antitoxin module